MASLERSEIIELLGRLGAESDQAVLDAARELNRKVSASGLTWEDLLHLDAGGAEAERDDEPLDEAAAAERPVATDGELSAAELAEAGRLIDRLLRKNLSSTLRGDLAEFKHNVADGSLDAMDARYIRALARRLGV